MNHPAVLKAIHMPNSSEIGFPWLVQVALTRDIRPESQGAYAIANTNSMCGAAMHMHMHTARPPACDSQDKRRGRPGPGHRSVAVPPVHAHTHEQALPEANSEVPRAGTLV
jgi:hypothetical protein